jgi:predicted secreted protein
MAAIFTSLAAWRAEHPSPPRHATSTKPRPSQQRCRLCNGLGSVLQYVCILCSFSQGDETWWCDSCRP